MRRILVLLCLFASGMVTAQDMNVTKGDFGFLKDQKEVNVRFDYSNMKLMKDNKTEEAYVTERRNDLNKKTPGVGDSWSKKWASSKEMIWEPKFMELVNTIFSKKRVGVVFQQNSEKAKYTLIVETVWIYPGWDAYVMKEKAKVSTVLKFVETANKQNVLLEITSNEAPGTQFGNNFSNESRIGEGYAKTGKSLAKLLVKNAF
jgi:hypothetical protein